MDKTALFDEFCRVNGIRSALREPLKEHCSFKIGGPADCMVWPKSEEQIAMLLRYAGENGIRTLILGKGSNVLFSDNGFRGVVICLGSDFSGIHRLDTVTLACDSGVTLIQLCRHAMELGLAGLEFAYGIPGSVGGAVYMNAGAYGGEMKDVLLRTHHLNPDGTTGSFEGGKMAFDYRHSPYTDSNMVITQAVFRLTAGDKGEIRSRMEDYMNRRKDKQPLEFPSAGSTFRRPPGAYASALIDQCGLKGRRVGGAVVSEKHAGFVVNAGDATYAHVMELIEIVKREVQEKTGHQLACEVKVIGE